MSAAQNTVQRRQLTKLARLKRDMQVLVDCIVPRRRRTRAERLALHKIIAKDPEVDRRLREFLARRPDFRSKTS